MATSSSKRRCLIMGAAGQDFHNFNMVLRDNPAYQVVAFTATQIPGISERCYPAALAGSLLLPCRSAFWRSGPFACWSNRVSPSSAPAAEGFRSCLAKTAHSQVSRR